MRRSQWFRRPSSAAYPEIYFILAKPLTALAVFAVTVATAFAEDALTAFDVVEDQTRFSFAPAPVFDDRMPAHGNPFISQGYIYPAGTLAGGETGVLENGDPAWPDQVLGTWTCDGWFVGDAMHGTTWTILISRQVFEFENGGILITQGPGIADQDTPFHRIIAGGTGNYADADGVIEQTLLGFSEHMGAMLTFALAEDDGGARGVALRYMRKFWRPLVAEQAFFVAGYALTKSGPHSALSESPLS